MDQYEEWRLIPSFPDYEVSNLGRVVSHKGNRPHVMRAGIGASGYPKVDFCQDRKKVTKSVHVLVCEAFHGPRAEGMEVRHLDGSKTNNAASNLAWGTSAENSADTRKHGTHANARKTHCPSGHPYVDGNILFKRGRRNCRTCTLAQNAARYLAQKAWAESAVAA